MTMPSRFDEKVNAFLAGFVVAVVPYAFTVLLFKDVPATARDIVMMLVGVMAANATQAVQNRFGSNPSQQRKDETIATQASTLAAAQAALPAVAGAVQDASVKLDPGQSAMVTAVDPNKDDPP